MESSHPGITVVDHLYEGHGWKLTLEEAKLLDGQTKRVSRVYTFDTVHILPLPTAKTVLLLREFRPLWQQYIWTLPSGKIDKETDASIAAQRELREETGYRSEKLEKYYTCNHWDRIPYTCHIFLAKELVQDALPKDFGENMEVHEMSVQEAIEKVQNCLPMHTVTAYTLLRYAREHGM